MSSEMEAPTCQTCQAPIVGYYCPTCGQHHRSGRITVRTLGEDLFNLLTNLERGLWHTLRGLLRSPGEVIRNYLGGATVRYYPPLRFLLLMAGLSALASSLVDYQKIIDFARVSSGIKITPEQAEVQAKILRSALQYTSLFISLNVPLSSIGSFLGFAKCRKTYAEHLVANSYLYGLQALLSCFTIWLLVEPSIYLATSFFNYLALLSINLWFYKSWFQMRWGETIWRTLVSIAITMCCVAIFAILLVLALGVLGLLPKM